jgi:hypothetical protein
MMKLMTDMQKRLSDLQKDVNQLKNEKFRPRKFDNIPRFNYGRGQVYGQNYGRGQGYGHNFGRGDGHRQNVSTASRIASFKLWGRDCLMCILISESARASIKCCFASVSRTFSGTVA